MKRFERKAYLEWLMKWKDQQIIKVVTGVRRCGKSTLLLMFREFLEKNGVDSKKCISINFEDLRYEELKDYHKLYVYIMEHVTEEGRYYIFLDEIQLVPDFQKAVDSLSKTMEVSRSQAGRLIMTESAAISSAAQKDCLKELGVEKYEILATLDGQTSEICRDMDGKVFDMKDYKVGITAPPFHPNCRSTTVPYFDDEFTEGEQRAARDGDGKTYYVPADMKYREWEKRFVVEMQIEPDIMKSGAVSGARNPNGNAAKDHAERYYGLVRSMKTDVPKIAKSTGYSEEQIQEIKNFIFLDKHDLGGPEPEYFAPDYMMAESWRRLIDGKPESHDLTLLKHEIKEKELIGQGYSQDEAHRLTSAEYNYSKEASKFYAKIKKYKKE